MPGGRVEYERMTEGQLIKRAVKLAHAVAIRAASTQELALRESQHDDLIFTLHQLQVKINERLF